MQGRDLPEQLTAFLARHERELTGFRRDLHMHPELAFAVQKAEIERLVADWRDEHPDVSVTVVRPALSVAEDHPGWLARSLKVAGSVRAPASQAGLPARGVAMVDSTIFSRFAS